VVDATGSDPAEPDQDENGRIVEFLVRCGVGDSVAHQLAIVGGALLSEAIARRVEVAAFFDLDSGLPVGQFQAGRGDTVDVAESLPLLKPDVRYVALHTHRESTSFSDLDLDLLLAHRPVHTIVAVGWDGTWHTLSKVDQHAIIDRTVALVAFRTALARLIGPFRARARSAGLPRDEATRDALHRIWRHLAPALNLRYARSR
jgi:hypothetical protein